MTAAGGGDDGEVTGSSCAGSGSSGTHGVLPEEKGRAQPFEIDLDLAVDLRPGRRSDRLSDTVDYGEVADAAAGVVSGSALRPARGPGRRPWPRPPWPRDPRIAAVTVHLRKLRPPLAVDIATVGVRITRSQ